MAHLSNWERLLLEVWKNPAPTALTMGEQRDEDGDTNRERLLVAEVMLTMLDLETQ